MAVVKTNSFMLSSATLMVAPAFTTDVFSLRPDLHSVGMAENIQVSVDSSLVELKTGIAQATVDAKRTGVSAGISATIFEYTAANLATALSLAAPNTVIKRGVLTANAASAAVSLSINSDPVPGDANSGITSLGDIPAGSTIIVQRAAANGDTAYAFPTVSSGVATGSGPFVIPIAGSSALPTGMGFQAGDKVWIVAPIAIADMGADQLYGVKIVGTLSNYDRPVVAVFPKVRMSKGFQVSFSEKDYGSMPWEMTPFLLTGSEATGALARIGTNAPGALYVGA